VVYANSRYPDQISPHREFHHAGMSITQFYMAAEILDNTDTLNAEYINVVDLSAVFDKETREHRFSRRPTMRQ